MSKFLYIVELELEEDVMPDGPSEMVVVVTDPERFFFEGTSTILLYETSGVNMPEAEPDTLRAGDKGMAIVRSVLDVHAAAFGAEDAWLPAPATKNEFAKFILQSAGSSSDGITKIFQGLRDRMQ